MLELDTNWKRLRRISQAVFCMCHQLRRNRRNVSWHGFVSNGQNLTLGSHFDGSTDGRNWDTAVIPGGSMYVRSRQELTFVRVLERRRQMARAAPNPESQLPS